MDDSLRKRYSRNIALPEIGLQGQEALFDTKVLIVGAGGLGAPVAQYLSAAGVGTIGIADGDKIQLSNLQRQILFTEADIGKNKAEITANRIKNANKKSKVSTYNKNIDKNTVSSILKKYDLIADCTDNFETRFTINTAAFTHKKALISASVVGMEGQLSTYKAYKKGNNPCFQCWCPKLPAEDQLPQCISNGVLGSVAGVMGTLQATEIIKELLAIGHGLSGKLLRYNAITQELITSKLSRDPECPTCGRS